MSTLLDTSVVSRRPLFFTSHYTSQLTWKWLFGRDVAAGLVALLYDHLLTINDEIELVWRARNTLPKTLFLINRYLVPLLMLVTIYRESPYAPSSTA